MTDIIIENITGIKDLELLSTLYKKGLIKLNISKLSKSLGYDRKTIKRYLKGDIPTGKRKREKYLDNYRDYILIALKDKYQSFDYIDHLYNYVKRERKITCNRATFNRYIRTDEELTKLFKKSHTALFTERFETLPGQQVQFDLKENMKLINEKGEITVVYIPTLTFGYSRFNYRKLVLDTKTETLLTFLVEAFEFIGGVPKEIVIDNLKAFVEKARYKDNKAILNPKFEEFCKNYNIEVKPCMPRRPQTKGKTETQNKIVDQMKNYNGKYKDIFDMHEKLEIINKEDNEGISQATHLPRVFLLQKEKGELLPLPSKEIRSMYHLNLDEVTVAADSLISYKSKKYSVPKTLIGKKVGLIIIRDELHIYYINKLVTIHKINENILNIKDEHHLKYEKKDNNKTKTIIMNEMENIIYD